MPRRSKGPRLYWRKSKGNKKAVYVIRDGQHEYSTGTVDREQAEAELRLYLIRKVQGPQSAVHTDVTVSQVLTIYGEGPALEAADPARIGYAIDALDAWWGDLPVKEVSIDRCKAYATQRDRAPGTVRRELGCLIAAINYAMPAGMARPKTWMPPRPAARDRWLTRDEAARLIRTARQNADTRHLVPFILIGLYTGSRKTDILSLKFHEHAAGGYVDVERGILYRKKKDARRTRKSAPTVRIPSRLLAHLRRWHRQNSSGWVVEFRGQGIADIKTAWGRLRKEAALPDVTRHTLRHTAITWAMHAAMPMWEASGFFGVSLETMERDYAHQHPEYQAGALDAANRGGRPPQ
ncbi:site-specific integrase [Pontivivens ytuae]|uniref:Site-specific integrase n=1 Tax=Pontivivens ytuae TaxID=2789856 RepID=A0A7S9LVP8_9RHOB|nr:site-specific integrase [Pontivivens ytuae]QPH55575.1 site-specific integrase [Pontivivens ytuae]